MRIKAACTPDFFLFDKDFKLVYRGQFDSSRPATGFPSPARICAPPLTRCSPASRSPEISARRSDAISSGRREGSESASRSKFSAQAHNRLTVADSRLADSLQSSNPFEIIAKLFAELRALERKFNGRLQHTELIAGVESLALKVIAEYFLVFQQCLEFRRSVVSLRWRPAWSSSSNSNTRGVRT